MVIIYDILTIMTQVILSWQPFFSKQSRRTSRILRIQIFFALSCKKMVIQPHIIIKNDAKIKIFRKCPNRMLEM